MGKSPGGGGGVMAPTKPAMGTMAAKSLPTGSGPINYFKNQSDIPVGVTGNIRPNPAAVGVNRVVGTPPPPQDMRASLAQMLTRNSGIIPDSFRGGGSRQRSSDAGYSTSGRNSWGGSSGGRGWW